MKKWYVDLSQETDSELIDTFISWMRKKIDEPIFNKTSAKYGKYNNGYRLIFKTEIDMLSIPLITLKHWKENKKIL